MPEQTYCILAVMRLLLSISILSHMGSGLIIPLTKSDGSLDVSSLLSHIALLEQIIESKASIKETAELKTQLLTALGDIKTSQAELTELKTIQTITHTELKTTQAELKATQTTVAVLQFQLNSANSQCLCNESTSSTQPSRVIASLKADVSTLKTEVVHLQTQWNASLLSRNVSNDGGATYTRWGRTVCPADAKIFYKGYTGGSWFDSKFSSATILCLPERPIYANNTSVGTGSNIYGTEYETYDTSSPFHSLLQEDMPCVVCESETKRSAIMVPARNQCYPGWNLEYSGYLMGAHYNHASAEFICVDKDPEAIPGGKEDKNGQVLYMTQSVCGSLVCPPYKDNWDLTCAVCSQ